MVIAVDDTDTADGNICVVTGSKDHYIKVPCRCEIHKYDSAENESAFLETVSSISNQVTSYFAIYDFTFGIVVFLVKRWCFVFHPIRDIGPKMHMPWNRFI